MPFLYGNKESRNVALVHALCWRPPAAMMSSPSSFQKGLPSERVAIVLFVRKWTRSVHRFKAPEGLQSPKYGWLELYDRKWAFIIDEPEEQDAKWYVDSNGDGDLTNDPATEWKILKEGAGSRYNGSAKIDLGQERIGQINAYRFDPNDKAREQLKNTLLFYTDFGTEYTLNLDGVEFKTSVAGSVSKKSRLWLDRDKNGRQSRGFETVAIDTPFNYTGTTSC